MSDQQAPRSEEYRVTDRELRQQPRGFDTVEAVLFNRPLMFGRGIKRPGPADSWEAWRDLVADVIVVRITRAEADGREHR